MSLLALYSLYSIMNLPPALTTVLCYLVLIFCAKLIIPLGVVMFGFITLRLSLILHGIASIKVPAFRVPRHGRRGIHCSFRMAHFSLHSAKRGLWLDPIRSIAHNLCGGRMARFADSAERNAIYTGDFEAAAKRSVLSPSRHPRRCCP